MQLHAIPALAALGASCALYHAYHLASFIHLHFLRRSSLHRYRETPDPAWALVTGATDGIGRGFAQELCSRGFNVILHGRNEEKLERVKKGLLQQWPQRQIRTLRIDADKDASDAAAFDRAATFVKDINLRLLINNVGGSGGLSSFVPLHERTSDQVKIFMDVNARFASEITRVLLPQLRSKTPALILNVGSTTGEFGIPYLSVYSGCKAYNKGWSQSLKAEMAAEEIDIEVLCILVSAVATDNVSRPLSLTVPSARQMASSALDKVGCGRSAVYGYWAHAAQAVLLSLVPASLSEKTIIAIGKQEKIDDEKRSRSQ